VRFNGGKCFKDSGGQGIPKDKVCKIVDSFYSGAGAGMAIAAKIVEDICGLLQIESKGGGGCNTVTVDIPVDGNPVDHTEMKLTTVLGVGNENRDNIFLHMLAEYKLESWAEMAAVLQSQKAIDKADTLYDGP
jgi:hypothetical protein